MERQQIPPFPTGDRFVETVEYGSEGVHPGICPFDAVSEGQKFGIQEIFLVISSMTAEIHFGNYPGALALSSEIVAVKSGIGI